MLKVASLQKGPEIRTGNTVGDADIPISEGTELNITTDEKYATACDDKNMSVECQMKPFAGPLLTHSLRLLQVCRLQKHYQSY